MFSNILLLLCTLSTALSTTAKPRTTVESFIPQGVTEFGGNLLKVISTAANTEKNILISPFNIYSALALIHLGAAGITLTELHDVLGLPNNDANETLVHETLKQAVHKIEAKADSKYSAFTETALANGLFLQKGFSIKRGYEQKANKFYNVKPTTVDFARNPQMATDTVNKWVSAKTKNRIPKLYKDEIDPSTSVLLTCALYFSGKWSDSFPEHKTSIAPFTTENKETINVHLMNNVKSVPYIEDTSYEYEAIRLPYEKGEYEMIIVLPSGQQTLKNLTAHMKYDNYKKLFNDPGTVGMDNGINYKIPRMKFSWSQSIKEALTQNGVKTLFERADLSNLVEANNLRVSDITHATEIEVDEKGTKASAVTGVKFVPYIGTIDPPTPKPFVVDRPFLMMIYHRPTSVLLFYGCIYNPLSSVE